MVSATDGVCHFGIITGDALEMLRRLPDGRIHTAVTSPPYYWARDYQVDGQIGHEDSVDEYVVRLADIFDEVKRVLHPDGVFYLNIGDTYYSGNGQPHGRDPKSGSRNFMRVKLRAVDRSGWDIPKKTLIGIPWKVVFEMQRRGWTLRSDIIWHRGNAFVEPTARDRPYRQYEHVFLFSKSRFYSFDRRALPPGEEDVWHIAIERSRRLQHNAPFPVELARRCIESGSPPLGWVLDPFVGSGTTMLAARSLGRHAIGVDLKREYTQGIREALLSSGCRKTEWDLMARILDNESPEYGCWRGNKSNFPVPRSRGNGVESS